MSKITKAFLVLGIGSVVPGLVINARLLDVTNIEGLYVLLPLGVILLGMFFISRLLDKETAADDRGREAPQSAEEAAAAAAPSSAKIEQDEAPQPSLSRAVEDLDDVEEHELQHH